MVKKRRKIAEWSLLEQRQAYGLTQEQMSQILMCSQPTVARWERLGQMPAIRLRLLIEWMRVNKRPERAG